MRKPIVALAALVVLGAIVAGWMWKGRFAVEGGRAPWAVINQRLDVLKEAIPRADREERQKALTFAVNRGPADAVELLLAAGATPNPPGPNCLLIAAFHLGGPDIVRLLLEAGADPKLCRDAESLGGEFLSVNFDRAPETELIWILRLLFERGVKIDGKGAFGTAPEVAEKKKLPKVAAYLRDPSATKVEDPALAPKLARLGGKAPIERDALKKVCEGEGIASLPAYQKQPNLVSPLYYFERRFEEFRYPGQLLPRWWTASDDPSDTQLVACVRVLDKKVVQECNYKGFKNALAIYDATFEIALREGKTGNQLAAKTVSLKAESTVCPMLKWGTAREAIFPTYLTELDALVRPFIGVEPSRPAAE